MGGEEALGAAATDWRIRAVVAEGATNRVAADRAFLSTAYGVRGRILQGIDRLTSAIAALLTAAGAPITLGAAADAAAPRRAAYPQGYFCRRSMAKRCAVRVDENATSDAIKRLRRAEGQIRGVIAMLEQGRDCADVVTQLAAVSRALDRAGFKIIASGLQQCLAAGETDADRRANLERMEKLFLSLA